MTRQELKTHKALVKQRDEAREIADKATKELDSIKGRANALASEEVNRVIHKAEVEIVRAEKEKTKAIEERAALKAEFGRAVAEKVDAGLAEARLAVLAVQKELASQKLEDVKDLRKRLSAKTNEVKRLEREVYDRDRFIKGVMQIPAVQELVAEMRRGPAPEATPEATPAPDTA